MTPEYLDTSPASTAPASQRSSRRAMMRMTAWAAPTIAVAAAAPAFANSTTAFGIQFDGGSNINGALGNSYLNLGIASGRPSPFVLTKPLTLTFNVVGLFANATATRDFSASSSFGTLTRGPYDNTTKTTPFTWTLPVGQSLRTVGNGSGVPDVLFSWRDGANNGGRITNKIVVTSLTGGNLMQVNTTTSTTPISMPVDSSVVKDNNQRAASPDGIY